MATLMFNKPRFCKRILESFRVRIGKQPRSLKEQEAEALAQQMLDFLTEALPDEAEAVQDTLEQLVDAVAEQSGGLTPEEATEIAQTAVVEFSKAFLANVQELWGIDPNSALRTDLIDALSDTYENIDDYIRIEEP